MDRARILAALIVMVAGTGSCERQGDDEDVVSRETCTTLCGLAVCDGASEPGPGQLTSCVDQCVSKGDDAQMIGQQCADAYSRAVDCFVNLTCDAYKQFEDGDDTMCSTERTAFTDTCRGMTFDFRE